MPKVRHVATILVVALLCAACTPQQRRQAYVDNHPELSEFTRTAILAGEVHMGMTEPEVLASWGPPLRRNDSCCIGGIYRSQWVYEVQYLYLEGPEKGSLRLASWQVMR